MLKDSEGEPKTTWKNMFETSLNEVELFYDAIWNDGKHDLEPKAVGDDGTKVVTSAVEEAEKPAVVKEKKEKKKEKKKAKKAAKKEEKPPRKKNLPKRKKPLKEEAAKKE